MLIASAVALTSLAAEAAPVDPASATPLQREQANARFKAGKDLYDQKKYDQALVELRASLDIVASPTTRLLAARCLRGMGKLVESYAELGRTMVEGKELSTTDPRYGKAAESAAEERANLERSIGLVTVEIDHPTDATTLTVAGETIRRGAWGEPAPVMPGETDVVVQTPGHQPIRERVTLQAGERKSLHVDAAQAAEIAGAAPPEQHTEVAADTSAPHDRQSLRPWAYVAGGVGAAGLLTFTIFGLMANSKYSDLQSACGTAPCPPSRADDVSAGKRDQTIANVGLAVGILGLGAGAALFVLSMPKSGGEGAAPSSASLVLGPAYLGVRGTL